MATQSFSFKSFRKFTLAAALGAAVFAPNGASAFGFHGGMGGGFGGGHFGGGFGAGHFGGGFRRLMPNHFASLSDPGFGRHPVPVHFPHPWHPHFPHCHHFDCGVGPIYGGGPVYAPAVETARVGVAQAPDCNAESGTYVIIGFVPTAAAVDVAKFLQAYQVVISDGPNQDSDFIIKLSDRKMTDKEIQAEMAAMQAETSIVRFVSLPETASVRN